MKGPPAIPDHTLLRPIGRGAYGEVWLARNVMGAWRAVKIVWRSQFESDRPYEREFAGVQRYEPVSRSADGLVHLLHVGRNDAEGYFYYVMELADTEREQVGKGKSEKAGNEFTAPISPAHFSTFSPADYSPRTLRSILKGLGRLPTADCLALALDVVSGLTRLHRQGLVHRDVKPGNIIYVDGRAKLADIGLIATGDEERSFVGTEGYIPPEGPGALSSDLYALGIVLYEASTGLRPERFPDVPADWLKDDAGDEALELHEVTLKCCEADRTRRYQTTEELQADLALLQSGQSVRRVRALEKRVKQLRRVGLAAALLVVSALVAAVFASWRAELAERQQARERQLRTRAESAEHRGRDLLHAAFTTQARALVRSFEAGRRADALEAVRQAAVIRVTPELRQHALTALALPDLELDREFPLGPEAGGVGIDHDFTRYAVGRGLNTVEVHSLAESNAILRLDRTSRADARFLRFSSDGRFLAFKRDRGTPGVADLEVWNLAATQLVLRVERAVSKDALDWHPRLPRLLVARPDLRLTEWDVERSVETVNWPLPTPAPLVCYAPDGGRLALTRPGSGLYYVEVRDTTNGALVAQATIPSLVQALAWHPAGRQLAVGGADGKVRLVQAHDGAQQVIGEHNAQVAGVVFPQNGEFLFSRGWDTTLNVWNLERHRRELSLAMSVGTMQAERGGPRLAIIAGSSAHLFRFSRAPECRELSAELPFTTRRAFFSPDQRWLCLDANEGLGVWDLQHPGPARLVTTGDTYVIGFSPDSTQLFAASGKGRRLLGWKLHTASVNDPSKHSWTKMPTNELPERLNAPEEMSRLAWTDARTGRMNALAGGDGSAALSADGQWLASHRARDPVLTMTRLMAPTNEWRFTNSALMRYQAFSPDSRRLAVLTADELKILDTATWQPVVRRAAAGKVFAHLKYSPDGRWLLCVENTETAALLDAATLESVLPFPRWHHPLAISPEGRWLILRMEGRRTQIWDFPALRARFRALGIDWEQ